MCELLASLIKNLCFLQRKDNHFCTEHHINAFLIPVPSLSCVIFHLISHPFYASPIFSCVIFHFMSRFFYADFIRRNIPHPRRPHTPGIFYPTCSYQCSPNLINTPEVWVPFKRTTLSHSSPSTLHNKKPFEAFPKDKSVLSYYNVNLLLNNNYCLFFKKQSHTFAPPFVRKRALVNGEIQVQLNY